MIFINFVRACVCVCYSINDLHGRRQLYINHFHKEIKLTVFGNKYPIYILCVHVDVLHT